ncbi:TIGR00295 family protein [Methanobrevibacter filiformis]|uniref:Ribonuclease Y n=1 Tax=Methanobrevibacter filiformis TaxID=55758 RepID=A0A166C5H5_9EURY|nr:TIGR00295 family protein [Methanobrevibacter filiformis]KZX11417.1 ribonuclease Y [Methanobrevibacter filiformis]
MNTYKIIDILKKENTPEWVIDHSKAVYERTKEISENFNVDEELIKQGALLHDIGRSRTNTISHGIIGSKIAIKYGFGKEVANIIERHIGSGIPKSEAIELGLGEKDYIPLTLEEKIVAHSDNLVNGSENVDLEFVIKKMKNTVQNPEYSIKRLKKLHEELFI